MENINWKLSKFKGKHLHFQHDLKKGMPNKPTNVDF
jgi:hypothetical protein